ncbi:LDCC motif putative metal-binding protein [Proteiniclasticum sediminis]|nr:LDCC motif putative metal-binding protein [Proteiniclasticum sediminis]
MLRWWKNFILRLGQSNKKTFGSGPLDCCTMNRKPQNPSSRS